MNQRRIPTSLLLSGLLAFAGFAQAQSGSAAATSNVPLKAGEASTMTQGRPNLNTTNTPGSATGSAMGATGATASGSGTQGGAAATSNVPLKAGEASTMTQGRPNLNTTNTPGSTTGSTMGTSGSTTSGAGTQGGAAATSNVPLKAGEASTMTQGRPNLNTTNAPGSTTGSTMGTGGSTASGAGSQSGAAGASAVPRKAGEASTMVNGRPNVNPNNPALTKSKEEIRTEKAMKKADRQARRQAAVMSQKGAQSGAPAGTSYNTPAGNPSVFQGGTPK